MIQCILMHQSRTISVLHLRSNFTFGTILPPIIEQVLCPRSTTFFPFLLLYNYNVREIYEMHCIVLILCVFNDTIPMPCIQRTSSTLSVLHLRSYSTFGTILPLIIEQVLCPRSTTFFSFFITL